VATTPLLTANRRNNELQEPDSFCSFYPGMIAVKTEATSPSLLALKWTRADPTERTLQ